MCKFCKDEETIFKREEISQASWGWGGEISIKESEKCTNDMALFIDKRSNITYLRYADSDDCNCLESGQKVEIQFCPFCGDKITEG